MGSGSEPCPTRILVGIRSLVCACPFKNSYFSQWDILTTTLIKRQGIKWLLVIEITLANWIQLKTKQLTPRETVLEAKARHSCLNLIWLIQFELIWGFMSNSSRNRRNDVRSWMRHTARAGRAGVCASDSRLYPPLSPPGCALLSLPRLRVMMAEL